MTNFWTWIFILVYTLCKIRFHFVELLYSLCRGGRGGKDGRGGKGVHLQNVVNRADCYR